MLGGIIAWAVSAYQNRNKNMDDFKTREQQSEQNGLLFASGLITGEALMGIALALPVAATGNKNVLALLENPLDSSIGLLVLLAISFWLYRVAVNAFSATD